MGKDRVHSRHKSHGHQTEQKGMNTREQTEPIMSGEAARFPVDIWEHYFRENYCIECL